MEGAAVDATKQLLEQGLLGVVIVLLLGGIVFLWRQNLVCQGDRIAELKRNYEMSQETNKSLMATAAALEGISRAMDARNRGTDELVKQIEQARSGSEVSRVRWEGIAKELERSITELHAKTAEIQKLASESKALAAETKSLVDQRLAALEHRMRDARGSS